MPAEVEQGALTALLQWVLHAWVAEAEVAVEVLILLSRTIPCTALPCR